MAIRQRWMVAIRILQCHPGACPSSDHEPVVIVIELLNRVSRRVGAHLRALQIRRTAAPVTAEHTTRKKKNKNAVSQIAAPASRMNGKYPRIREKKEVIQA